MTQHTAEDRYGTLDVDDGRAVVRFTRRLPHRQRTVWAAVTDSRHLAAWFPTTIDGERATGATLTFRFPDIDLPPMTGTMVTFDPPSTMEFTWADDVVRIELAPDGDAATVLTLVVTMAELGKAARDGAGWHLCLDNLAIDLAGEPPASAHGDAWRPLNNDYVARFGPDASTVGPPQGVAGQVRRPEGVSAGPVSARRRNAVPAPAAPVPPQA
jgi:uncharacterized protein YndB with AHSA1/START domain